MADQKVRYPLICDAIRELASALEREGASPGDVTAALGGIAFERLVEDFGRADAATVLEEIAHDMRMEPFRRRAAIHVVRPPVGRR